VIRVVELTGDLQPRRIPDVIYYLMLQRDWESGSTDRVAEPSAGESFVHCCDEHQIADVRRRYFPPNEGVVSLAFDPTRLLAETRYEPGSDGEPERFPHVYGPLYRKLVEFTRGA
jgi:uncharacterized protein (DUF952 family)